MIDKKTFFCLLLFHTITWIEFKIISILIFKVKKTLYRTSPTIALFQLSTFSNNWPSGPMLSLSQNVRLCVCPSNCPWQKYFMGPFQFLFRYRLNVFLPPVPKVRCPIFLGIRNSWGKVMERSGLRFEYFYLEVVLNRRAKKFFFFCWFYLTKHGRNHTSQWIKDLWSKGISLILAYL